MALLRPAKSNLTNKRVQQILATGNKALEFLTDRAPVPVDLEPELEVAIETSFPLPSCRSLAGQSEAFDSLGTALWNAATNLVRQEETDEETHVQRKEAARLIALLRAFAYLLIDAACRASTHRTKFHDQQIRTFKLALKSCRYCLSKGHGDLAQKVAETCSDQLAVFETTLPAVHTDEDPGRAESDQHHASKRLVTEYHLMRMTLAWKTDRFDLADHFYAKLDVGELSKSAQLAEDTADLLHEAGISLSTKNATTCAIKWCERALDALDVCDLEHASQDAPELRFAITVTLVDLLSTLRDAQSLERCSDLVEQLATTHGLGNRIAVTVMRFNVLTAAPTINLQLVNDTLSRMTRLAVLTDKTFQVIIHTIHRAQKFSTNSALSALEELINKRLLPDSANRGQEDVAQSRLEKATVTHVLLATTQVEHPPETVIARLEILLAGIVERSSYVFSAKATHAAQTLIWKVAGTPNSSVITAWCAILQHPIFGSAGRINKAKIGRKAMMAALAQGDCDGARKILHQLPSDTQNESITRYLTFKLALKSMDNELAAESLHEIVRHAEKDATFLYACVLEAQQSDMRRMTVMALQALLGKQPSGIHLPSLLRCTVRLLIGELDAPNANVIAVVEEIVCAFQTAAANIKPFKQGTDEQWFSEVQWWSKNAYNLALSRCAEIYPEQLVRLLAACTTFLDCYQHDAASADLNDIFRRRALVHFLSASALIVIGRSNEEMSENALQAYLQARSEIAAFQSCASKLNDRAHPDSSLPNSEELSLRSKTFEVLKFDLECVVRLQCWEELGSALQNLLDFDGTDRWASLIDLVLIVQEQGSRMNLTSRTTARISELLQKCINETWKQDKDIVKMCRWLRLTFTIYLQSDEAESAASALKIVAQAAGIARRLTEEPRAWGQSYPEAELQWLATTAFNEAVDFLSNGDEERAGQWIEAALQLARYAADNGALHANLTHKKRAAGERLSRAGRALHP